MKRTLISIMTVALTLTTWSLRAAINPQITEAYMDIVAFDPEGAEASPGDFIALGSRKEIKCWVNVAGRASLSWASTKIKVYDSATGITPLPTEPASSSAGRKYEFDATPTPRSFFIQGVTVSDGLAEEKLLFEALHVAPYPHDSVAFTVVDLKITSVPYSYYADSDSWVPFRFCAKLESSSAVNITGGKVEFYIGDVKQFEKPLCAKPFKPANGTAVEYLAVVDESAFDTISTSGGVVPNASFRLKDVCFTIGTDSFGPCNSERSTPFLFGDKTIEIIEFGKNEDFDHLKASTRQNLRDISENNSFHHMAGDTYCGTCPHETTNISILDFDQGYAGLMPGGSATAWTQRSYLYDDLDATGVFSGNTVEARSFNRQRGVYWVAFRNQVSASAPGNPFGVPVVGTVATLPGSIALFPNGTARVTITEGGVNMDDLTTAFGYACAAAGLGAAFVAPPAAAILGGATAIFGGLAAISDAAGIILGSDPDMAEVVAYKVIDIADGSTRPSQANAVDIVREFTAVAKPEVPLGIGNPGLEMVVDNTYTMYLSSSTNVRALSRSIETIKIDARLAIDLGTGRFDVVWPTIPPEQRNVISCDF